MSEEMDKIKKVAAHAKEEFNETIDDLSQKAKHATESAKEGFEHFTENASHATANISESISEATNKTVSFFEPITQKVRDIILGLGEVIVTIFAVVGIVAAIVNGLSDMATIGFFSGLSSMFQSIVSVVMGALVIFLLFAIKDSLDKK